MSCRGLQIILSNLTFHSTSVTAAMVLRRYTISVDGSIPVQALLYDDEELLTSQDGVGIYDG